MVNVATSTSESLYVDGQLQPPDVDIQLQPFELVYSTNHTLNVSYPS